MKTLTSGARRILCAALVLLLCAALLPTAALAAKAEASATTMRLESATGTVTVRNASSQSKSLFNNMQLYSGWSVETAASASATLSLDGSKAVKLDAGTKVELKQNTATKKLELFLSKGKLFFDVSEKLASDESMNIRTSTMVCGIRGTIGEAGVLMPEEESAAPTSYLLLGEGASDVMYYAQGTGVESAAIPVNVALPASTLSQLQVLRVEAGQRLTLTEDAAGRVEPQITRFTDDPLDLNGFSGFSLGDLTAEPDLIARIRAATGGTLDYDDLTADQVQERQKMECTRLELLQQKLRTQQEILIQRLKAELRLQKTNTIDTWTGGNSGTGGGGGIAPAPDPTQGEYTISIDTEIKNGAVSASRLSADAGDTVTLTVLPDQGYRISQVTYTAQFGRVVVLPVNGGYSFIMPAGNVMVSAFFTLAPVTGYSVVPNFNARYGTLTVDKDSAVPGEIITATAKANRGYQISTSLLEVVTDEYIPDSATQNADGSITYRFVMADPTPHNSDFVKIYVDFVPFFRTVAVAGGITGGTVEINQNVAIIGQTITVTPTPAAGNELKELYYIKENTTEHVAIEKDADGVYSFVIDEASVTVYAVFEAPEYALSAARAENGSIALSVDGQAAEKAAAGKTVTVAVTPDTNYQLGTLVYVYTDAAGGHETDVAYDPQTKQYTFTMPAAATTVCATFTAIPYAVTVADGKFPAGCALVASPTTAGIGDTVTLTVTEGRGYELTALSYLQDGQQTPVAITDNCFTMPGGPVTVNATFEDIDRPRTIRFSETLLDAFGEEDVDVELRAYRKDGDNYIPLELDENDFSISGAVPGEKYQVEFFGDPRRPFVDPASVTVAGRSAVETEMNLSSGDWITADYTFVMPREDLLVSASLAPCFEVRGYENNLGTALITSVGGRALEWPSYRVFAAYDAEGHGDVVTLEVTPNAGARLKVNGLTAQYYDDEKGSYVPVALTAVDEAEGLYSFEMVPGNVTVSASFGKRNAITTSLTRVGGYQGGTLSITVNGEQQEGIVYAVGGDTVLLTFTVPAQDGEYYGVGDVRAWDSYEESQALEMTRSFDPATGIYTAAYSFVMPDDAVFVTATFSKLKEISLEYEGNQPNGSMLCDAINLSSDASAPRYVACEGEPLTLTPAPDAGYGLNSLELSAGLGYEAQLAWSDGAYSLVMSDSALTVTAGFGKLYTLDTVSHLTGAANADMTCEVKHSVPGLDEGIASFVTAELNDGKALIPEYQTVAVMVSCPQVNDEYRGFKDLSVWKYPADADPESIVNGDNQYNYSAYRGLGENGEIVTTANFVMPGVDVGLKGTYTAFRQVSIAPGVYDPELGGINGIGLYDSSDVETPTAMGIDISGDMPSLTPETVLAAAGEGIRLPRQGEFLNGWFNVDYTEAAPGTNPTYQRLTEYSGSNYGYYAFVMPDEDVTVKAVRRGKITLTQPDNGTLAVITDDDVVSVGNNVYRAPNGTEVTLTLTADPTYCPKTLTVTGADGHAVTATLTGRAYADDAAAVKVTATYTFEMPLQDVTVTAECAALVKLNVQTENGSVNDLVMVAGGAETEAFYEGQLQFTDDNVCVTDVPTYEGETLYLWFALEEQSRGAYMVYVNDVPLEPTDGRWCVTTEEDLLFCAAYHKYYTLTLEPHSLDYTLYVNGAEQTVTGMSLEVLEGREVKLRVNTEPQSKEVLVVELVYDNEERALQKDNDGYFTFDMPGENATLRFQMMAIV